MKFGSFHSHSVDDGGFIAFAEVPAVLIASASGAGIVILRVLLATALLALSACSPATEKGRGAESSDTLEAIARDYVLLSLTIGEKDEGYIDSYYGPGDLQ